MEPSAINIQNNLTKLNISRWQMNNSNSSVTNDSQSNIADIIQIPLFVFIIVLAGIYTILILSRKTLRENKFTWLTVNVCLAMIFFAIIQLLSTGIRLNNVSETVIPCRPKGFIINMATCHIMYSHSIASFCRLFSIKYPHKLFFRSWHWLLSSIVMSWIVGIFFALPYLFFDGFTCSSNYGEQFLKIYTSLMIILVPITIVTVCNIIIFRYIRRSSQRVHDLNNNHNHPLGRRDMHICKIMLLTFIIFVIGWAPLFCQQLFFNNDIDIPSGVTTVFRLLPPTSLLADVILLIYSDQPARSLLLKPFKCHRLQHG